MTEPVVCSLAAAQEPLAGSAPHTSAWLAVEAPGPWGRSALTDNRLPDQARAALVTLAAHPGLRLQLLRRPGSTSPGAERTVLVCGRDAAGPWIESTTVAADDLAGLLAGIDPVALCGGQRPGWTAVLTPVALVCANGSRDRCCAVAGRALAQAVAAGGADAWETSHLGGHRFAPTAAVLPSGAVLGRAGADDVTAACFGEIRPEKLRGFAWLTPAHQAAEAAVRVVTGLTAAVPLAVVDAGEETVTVAAADGPTWRVEVHAQRVTGVLSCGAAPAESLWWRSVVHPVAPTPAPGP